jgi:predicted HTH domain antitoxin
MNQKKLKATMANQRHPDKTRLQAWMFEKDIKALKRAAEEAEMPLSEFLMELTKLHKKLKDGKLKPTD